MEPSFKPVPRQKVHKNVKRLPAYVNSGESGNGLMVELKTDPRSHGWHSLTAKYGWYVDRIVFQDSSVFVAIFPITEVPDSDGE